MTRRIKILLREKAGSSFKVVTNVRWKGRSKQLHLGYIPRHGGDYRMADRAKLQRALVNKWHALFGEVDVTIDWADARRKLRLKSGACSTRGPRDSAIPSAVLTCIER